jgi:hypothetical protein
MSTSGARMHARPGSSERAGHGEGSGRARGRVQAGGGAGAHAGGGARGWRGHGEAGWTPSLVTTYGVVPSILHIIVIFFVPFIYFIQIFLLTPQRTGTHHCIHAARGQGSKSIKGSQFVFHSIARAPT